MIRILFIILAVVAALMAMLLQREELYYVAGGLLVVAVILIATSLSRRRKRHRQAKSTTYTPPEPAEPDDLSSLGILEIRPKNKGGAPAPVPEPAAEAEAEAEAAPAPAETAEEGEEEEPAEPPAPSGGGRKGSYDPSLPVKHRPPSVQAVDAEVEAPRFGEVVGPYLQALRAALDAQTVCLLKQREIALRYHIEAIVSQNAYARSSGHFATRAPLLNASEARKPVTVRRVGDGGLDPANLAYYREPIAVRQVALAPVPHPTTSEMHFLLADVMQDGALGGARQRMLLAEFARLLSTLMEKPARDDRPEDADEPRPRRDIIAEEMEKARAKRRPLALGLVYLNRAEARADDGEAAVATAETALADELRRRTRKGRVERFGELTFGVFLNEPVGDVEAWALELQRDLAGAPGPLEGGVSIGFAMLHERHDDADTFRADATAALHEAYESGTCIILE